MAKNRCCGDFNEVCVASLKPNSHLSKIGPQNFGTFSPKIQRQTNYHFTCHYLGLSYFVSSASYFVPLAHIWRESTFPFETRKVPERSQEIGCTFWCKITTFQTSDST